jgi:hypothetical protein
MLLFFEKLLFLLLSINVSILTKNLVRTAQHRINTTKLDDFTVRDYSGMSKEKEGR